MQLCRDCLLIVYQFAADAKAAGAASVVSQGTTPQESNMRLVKKLGHGPVTNASRFETNSGFRIFWILDLK